jgi:hypothetical protein
MRTLAALLIGLILIAVVCFFCVAAGVALGGSDSVAAASWTSVAWVVISTIFYLIGKD